METGPTATFLNELGDRLDKPRGILCISAHWDTPTPRLTGAKRPETIHDYYGFPAALYELDYPAPGAPDLAADAANLLEAVGFNAQVDDNRGLDHGAWVPLRLMYPDADVPVVQLSLQARGGPQRHYELGRVLAPLRDRGILVMGSGGATHNLMDLRAPGTSAADYARDFDAWLSAAVGDGRVNDLLAYRTRSEYGRRAHPSEEHLLPLFVPLGAAGGVPGRVIHQAFSYGTLSLAAYLWD